ncbi:hypothetical protein BDV97DRAFT_267863, partial [Delphinella strobiligena]
LKPTYKPPPSLAPLPPGWTEHTAPSGHKYYYNAQTKQSTYTRPAPAPTSASTPPVEQAPPLFAASDSGPQDYAALAQQYATGQNAFPRPNNQYGAVPFQQPQSTVNVADNRKPHRYQRRPQPEDRPKKKAIIPDCAPWILIYTTLGRRFVHNTETQESLWKFPADVVKAVIEFDKLELEKKLANKDEATGANNIPVRENTRRRPSPTTAAPEAEDGDAAEDSSEYEEIEVTDDEDEEEDQAAADAPQEDQPVEFGEDDIAYQLAQMGEQHGLDPGEYDDGTLDPSYEEGAEGLPLTEEDSAALFCDLLDDYKISPFTPYEKLIEDGHIIQDSRYTALPTTKSRKDIHDQWSRTRIAALKTARQTQEKLNPRIPYLTLLSQSATPKLYWPEFKRKHKRDPALCKDHPRFGDKEREKLYRDHISRLRLPTSTLKADLVALLRSLPLDILNRDSDPTHPPNELLADLRWISLPPATRDPLFAAHISTLPSAPEGGEEGSVEERAERERRARERERRERALRERERKVDEEKRRRERDIRIGRGRLREGERELEDAMRVGRSGLRAQL